MTVIFFSDIRSLLMRSFSTKCCALTNYDSSFVKSAFIWNKHFHNHVSSKPCRQIEHSIKHELKISSSNVKVTDKEQDKTKNRIPRPPIVTVMGHIDHGKTTLLDTLKKTSVAASEEGGITQRLGVFKVPLQNKKFATFLDTPGHVAFNTMRRRGANITDIIVLIVAADDGVKDQTIDCITLAAETNTPIIVAINKIDKPEANIKKTQQSLLENGIIVEQLHGHVQCIPISALKGTNLNKLLEAIELEAEDMQLTGDPTSPVKGYIIETGVDVYLGKRATILIQNGTLRRGKVLVTENSMVKIKSMHDYMGQPIETATLSDAVQISGWNNAPSAGDTVMEVTNIKEGTKILEQRSKASKLRSLEEQKEPDSLPKEQKSDTKSVQNNVEQYSVILKTNSEGTMDALQHLLSAYDQHDLCRLVVVHAGIGNVTKGDFDLAETFNATIYCFNSILPKNMISEMKERNIAVYSSNIIYRITDHIKQKVSKKFPTLQQENVLGEANVLATFTSKKSSHVAGCLCVKGVIRSTAMFHLIRNGEIIDTGNIRSIRQEKLKVTEIKQGLECGIKFENKSLVPEVGDTVVCFEYINVIPECTWNTGE